MTTTTTTETAHKVLELAGTKIANLLAGLEPGHVLGRVNGWMRIGPQDVLDSLNRQYQVDPDKAWVRELDFTSKNIIKAVLP